MNGDYVPLDQEVIGEEVAKFEKKRNEAKNVLRDAIKNAGGNYDIMVFHATRKDYNNFRRIIKALDELGIFWTEVNGEIYASRHEVYDIVGYRE